MQHHLQNLDRQSVFRAVACGCLGMLVAGCEPATSTAEVESPAARDPHFLDAEARHGDRVTYAVLSGDGAHGVIRAFTFDDSERVPEVVSYEWTFPNGWPLEGTGQQTNGTTFPLSRHETWLRDMFFHDPFAPFGTEPLPIAASIDAPVLLQGHATAGIHHSVRFDDTRTLRFELTPALPAGGLARVVLVDTAGDGPVETALVEAIGQQRAVPLAGQPVPGCVPSLPACRNFAPQASGLVEWADSPETLRAAEQLLAFLTRWVDAGQPATPAESDFPFHEAVEHLLLDFPEPAPHVDPAMVHGLDWRLTGSEGAMAQVRPVAIRSTHPGQAEFVVVFVDIDGESHDVAYQVRLGDRDATGQPRPRIWDVVHGGDTDSLRPRIGAVMGR